MDKFIELIYACWAVLGQMSPYLLLGFLISGVLSVLISPQWVEKHLGSSKFGSIVKATLLGVPLPLCSCGVIPVSASLRRSGASKGATTSFLISTPQTGVDSMLATYGLLGPFFAIFRPLAALITGIIGGMAVAFLDPEDNSGSIKNNTQNETAGPSTTTVQKIMAALKYALVTLPGEIARALLVGVLIAGLISTFISADFVSQYIGNYYVTMFLMLAIGIPIYVCSTSSIPIALGFMHMGVSPGAAFVFLISGPATNAAAITVVWKILGKKSAIIYLFTVILGSLAGGFAFDYLQKSFSIASFTPAQACHVELSTIEIVSAVFMLLVLVYSYYQTKITPSCCSSCAKNADAEVAAANLVISIDGMSCGNCANAVTRALMQIKGVSEARVSLTEKQAMVFGATLNVDEIINTVNTLGYNASQKPN